MSNLQQIICSMQAFFLINDPWLLPYKSFLWHIHYKSITNTLTLTQDQRVRVARSAHEVDLLQPELRPACANTTRVETPRIAVWDILTTWKWKWKMKVLSYLTDYFQMHWHADKNLFSNALACTYKSIFRDSFGHLRMIINDDHYLQRVEVFFTQKIFFTIPSISLELQKFLYASGCNCYFEADWAQSKNQTKIKFKTNSPCKTPFTDIGHITWLGRSNIFHNISWWWVFLLLASTFQLEQSDRKIEH